MISNPHDALFKVIFDKPEHARGPLLSIVPAAVAGALDWSMLTLRPGSFVDTALAQQHTDLLYSTRWRGGGKALVYFLFEHQSTLPSDGLMAHRLLRYKVRIWDRWRGDHPKAKTLPMIVPVVMYHGAAPWSEARSFDALLDVPAGMRKAVEPYLVRFKYALNDLSQVSDDELHAAAWTAQAKLATMCFKHARTDADLLGVLVRWIDVIREVASAPHGLEALAQVMRYILQVNQDVTAEALEVFLEREIGPEAKDTIVTTGQQLIEQGIEQGRQQGIEQGRQQGIEQGRQQGIEQGRQQGIEQGRQQGIEQGRQQGIEQGRQRIQQVLLRQLRQRFGKEVDARVEQRIATASIDEIDTWSVRVLSVATLAEVFAD
jgi:predicted transposase/invertase (TIGR01784 family)